VVALLAGGLVGVAAPAQATGTADLIGSEPCGNDIYFGYEKDKFQIVGDERSRAEAACEGLGLRLTGFVIYTGEGALPKAHCPIRPEASRL